MIQIKYDRVIYHVIAWKHYRFVMFCFNSTWLAETSPTPRPWGAKLRTIDWTNQLLALKHQGWWSFFGSWFSLSTILKNLFDLVDTLIIIEHQTPHTLSANRKVHHKVSLYDSHLICKTQVFDSPIHLNLPLKRTNTWGDFRIATEELRLQKNEAFGKLCWIPSVFIDFYSVLVAESETKIETWGIPSDPRFLWWNYLSWCFSFIP